jgi:hypothetical protein
MARKAKAVSMDAAFKSLLRNLDIPGKKDIDKLNAKIDRLEKMIKKAAVAQTVKGKKAWTKQKDKKSGARRLSATSVVLESITRSKKGADFASLQTKTGFEEKKLRNIIFRLNKLGKVKRVGRGLYFAA